MLRRLFGVLALGLGLAGAVQGQAPEAPGNWPQWRGPKRDGISPETGLLKEWPEGGPPLLWKVKGIGTGYAPVSVAGGRIVSLGYRKDQEVVFALDGDGKELWATPIGPAREAVGMQWLSQRQPTVDDERVYAVTNYGGLFCLDSTTGKILWSKSYRMDFGGRVGTYGYCDYPLVDAERLICSPGGATATLVALNKKTGEAIWKAVVPEGDGADHSALVVMEVGGVRQYVKFLRKGLVGIKAADGRFLWRYDRVANGTIHVPTPAVYEDLVWVGAGYGQGTALIKLTATEKEVRPEEVYYTRQNVYYWNAGPLIRQEHLFADLASGLHCMNLKTGKETWKEPKVRQSSGLIYADGHIYFWLNTGAIKLFEVSPEKGRETGDFALPDTINSPTRPVPVIAGGRLYLRNQDSLYCYDIKAKPHSRGPPFGSGEGRIVICANGVLNVPAESRLHAVQEKK